LLSHRLAPNKNVLFNIARCFEALKRHEEAFRYWSDLNEDPSLLESDRKEALRALRRLAPHLALVEVSTSPVSAELFVDREDLGSRGQTPQTLALTPGRHSLIVKRAGFRSNETSVVVAKGTKVTRAIELVRLSGVVHLSGVPAGAAVRESANGPILATVPGTVRLPPGKRFIVVDAPDAFSQQFVVEVLPDAETHLRVELINKPRPVGTLLVTSNREAAVVRIDGRNSGFTPTVLELSVGEHQVEVLSEEVASVTRRVSIQANSETHFDAVLRYEPPPILAASRQPLSADQAPASTTIITRDEIAAFGYQTLPEALRAVRGLFFTDDRIYTYVGVRGFSPAGDLNTRILVLYDGHSVNDVWAGQGYLARDFDIDLAEVDRIEVVRGPASLLFGTGAFFGVINVIPRDRLSRRNAEGSTAVGGQGGVKARATASFEADDASALVSAAGWWAAGAPFTDLAEDGVIRGLDDERALGATARARWKSVSFSAKWLQRRKTIPTGPLGSQIGVAGTQYTDARGFAELKLNHVLESVAVSARLAYDGSRYRGTFASLDENSERVTASDLGGADWLTASLRLAAEPFPRNRLTFDVESQVQLVSQQPFETRAPARRLRLLVTTSVVDEWEIVAQRLFLQVGLRVDKYKDIRELALSPRIAMVARFYQTGLSKLVVSRAFRAPTLYELFYNTAPSEASTALASALLPETITSFEVEHTHCLTPEFRVTVGAYTNVVDRLVVLAGDDNQSSDARIELPARYRNQTRSLQSFGAEAHLRWQPGRFTLVDASYSFVTFDPERSLAGAPHPTHLASARVMAPLHGSVLRAAAQATYQSSRALQSGSASGEALVMSVGFSGEYDRLRYYAGVHNLLDQGYSLPTAGELRPRTVPQYGRTFWLELVASL
jgi:outer membrane receptor protein involved in Fe transport